MKREGRLAGRPSNHSRTTRKCKIVDCEACHDSLPLKKSRGKGKGRIKRLVSDIPSTHLVTDWRVTKPKGARKWEADTDWDEEGEANHDGYGEEPEGWALSISLLLDTALEHIRRRKAGAEALKESDDEAEVPDLLENENEIEAGGSPPSVAGSADSWSAIDQSDLGDWEDDWSLVGDEYCADPILQ